MSREARDHVRKHSRRKGSEFHLLMAIAEYADKNGVAWPSIPTLAKDLRMSERHVKRMVTNLDGTDELTVKRNASRAGTHLYQLNMGLSLELFDGNVGDTASRDTASPGDNGSKRGVTSKAKMGDTVMSPERRTKNRTGRPSRGNGSRVDNSHTPPAAADLKFPQGTTPRQQEALLKIARGFGLRREQLQLAFDEVGDRLERRERVDNVVALTKAIAQQIRDGTFYGARAERHAQKTRAGGRPLTAAELKLVAGKKAA